MARRALPLLLLLCACGPDGGVVVVRVDDDPGILDVTSAWIGTYDGAGEGSLAGAPVRFDEARLTIRLDADSVARADCIRCLTVRLDSLFQLVHVDPTSEVGLSLAYERDGIRRTLRLDRYSGGGGIGNVLTARLEWKPADPAHAASDTTGDITYLFERR